ncbi:hypothetical protein X275_04105 [Marinitoga sp. 1197]|uniref:hypothetical protein n=1 Tax=Marinitoga sp. 1197 TaxID=1428449 RepID=UPI000640E3D7|nr:hypothetical protein [Marinitoga sp. 1197]KLO23049.1 hypothetical protein X275_04105 [Marinitoga sp. 1197]
MKKGIFVIIFFVLLLILFGCVDQSKTEIITPTFIEKPEEKNLINLDQNHLYVSYDSSGKQVVSGLVTIDSDASLTYLRVSSMEKTLWYTDILKKFDNQNLKTVFCDSEEGNVYLNGSFKFDNNNRTVLLYPKGKDLPQSIYTKQLYNKIILENGKTWNSLQFDEKNNLFAVSDESSKLLVFDNTIDMSKEPTDLNISLDVSNLYYKILSGNKVLYKQKNTTTNKTELIISDYNLINGDTLSSTTIISDMSNIKGPFVLNNDKLLYGEKEDNKIIKLKITKNIETSSNATAFSLFENRTTNDFQLVGVTNADIDNSESYVSTVTYGDIIDGYIYENSTFIILKDFSLESTLVISDLTQGATNVVSANYTIPLVVLEFPYSNEQTFTGNGEMKIHFLGDSTLVNDNTDIYISPENYIIMKNGINLYKIDLRSSIPADFIISYISGNLKYNVKLPYLRAYKLNIVNLTSNKLSLSNITNISKINFYDNYARFAYIEYGENNIAIYDLLKDNIYLNKPNTEIKLNKNMTVEEFTQVFEEIVRNSK